MTPERHEQISEMYERVLEVAPDHRSAFLAEACAGDEALGTEVASLLAARAEASGFLSMPALHIAAQELAASRPSTPLRAIGPYEIRALLGRGGMGEVYRAHDTRLGRDVALKLLPAQLALDPQHLARFEREARLVASLNHPNIAAVYGVEEESGRRALVLELVDGVTLAERLTSGPVAVHDAPAIARQIADALEAAHDRGIVHRDLKPGNVMLRPDGAVKVLDFGLAKALDPAQVSDPALRQVTTRLDGNAVMGTLAYMSPEQVRGMPVDQRSDIWAFGGVLYEMLTGRRAFDGETSSDVIAALLERTPDWSALPADTPAAVRRLLHRCLEKDPKRRLRHIADVRADLADADGTPPDPVTPGRRPWRARALTRTLASVAVFGLIGAAIAFNGRMRNSARTNGVRQYALLPPDGAAFGNSVVDRTPSFAISPDGHRLAFVASSPSSRARLWVRPIDGLTADPLAGTEGAASPFWSPDGLSVGLFADGKLKRVNLAGGAPLVLADASSGSGGTWNRSGDIVYAPTPQGPLWHVPAGGGTPRAVTQLGSGELGHVQPQFLPDGRHFLYLVRAAEPRRGIYVSSLDSPEPRRIVAARERALYAAPGYLLFLREGRLFGQPFDARRLELSGDAVPLVDSVAFISTEGRASYAVSDNGTLVYRVSGVLATTQPLWVDHSGRVIGLAAEPGDYQTIRLSPDGSRMASELHDLRTATGDLWIIELATGQKSRFTVDGMHNNEGVWSPDGRQLVFVGRPNGVRNLHLKPVDGSTADYPLLAPGHDRMPLDWSPDGRHILFREQDPDTNMDVWALRMPERVPIPFLRTGFREEDAKFSPDGRWVAFMSDETGREEIYVTSFPEGTVKRKVSLDGGRAPRWSRNGKELFFVESNRTIMVAPARWNGQPTFGLPRPLFTHQMRSMSPPLQADAWFNVSGPRFLILPPPSGPAPPAPPLTVVENWTALLKGR